MSAEADKAGDKVDRWGQRTKDEAYRAGDRAEDAVYGADAKVLVVHRCLLHRRHLLKTAES